MTDGEKFDLILEEMRGMKSDMQDMKTKGRRPLFYNVEMQNHISI